MTQEEKTLKAAEIIANDDSPEIDAILDKWIDETIWKLGEKAFEQKLEGLIPRIAETMLPERLSSFISYAMHYAYSHPRDPSDPCKPYDVWAQEFFDDMKNVSAIDGDYDSLEDCIQDISGSIGFGTQHCVTAKGMAADFYSQYLDLKRAELYGICKKIDPKFDYFKYLEKQKEAC